MTQHCPIWKRVPLLRPLLAFTAGIVVQYYGDLEAVCFFCLPAISLVLLLLHSSWRIAEKFSYGWIAGIAFNIHFFVAGNLACSLHAKAAGNGLRLPLHGPAFVTAVLDEPPALKAATYKSVAHLQGSFYDGQWHPVSVGMLLYLDKKIYPLPGYGSHIVFPASSLQLIRNPGNPGCFDYRWYCALQGIHYQAIFTDSSSCLTTGGRPFFAQRWLAGLKQKILTTLRTALPAENQYGVAEALLAGYRKDLDSDLAQSYSNTGAVHIIAISGLHLGMVYGLLLALLSPFRRFRLARSIEPVILLTVLWVFCFMAGATPSVLRSTIMFSSIALGNCFRRRMDIYNSLAVSAFAILLFQPFSLWDAGFQLSYAAVLSIVSFSRHVRYWLPFKNKLLSRTWNLCSVTLAAQVFTLPLVLYHFHSFPLLFFFTNLLAVPLSGLILYSGLLLLATASIPWAGTVCAMVTGHSISLMNGFILRASSLPFSSWSSIQLSTPRVVLLYGAILFLAHWLTRKKKNAIIPGLACLLLFLILRCADFLECEERCQLVVYQVPRCTAVEWITGRSAVLKSDLAGKAGGLAEFYLHPARLLYRVSNEEEHPIARDQCLLTNGKRSVLVAGPLFHPVQLPGNKPPDAIILTHNVHIGIAELSGLYHCNQYVFDGSNSGRSISRWTRQADSLHLRHHSTATEGAFIMDMH